MSIIRFEFEHELLVMLVGPFGVFGIGLQPRPWRVVAAADLILPDHHAQPIAVIVVASRFDLDVLADHVEAGRLQKLDVEQHRFVGWRRQQSIRPPALIERSPDERSASPLSVNRQWPSASLTLPTVRMPAYDFDAVERFAVGIEQRDLEVVEVRRRRGPELGVLDR